MKVGRTHRRPGVREGAAPGDPGASGPAGALVSAAIAKRRRRIVGRRAGGGKRRGPVLPALVSAAIGLLMASVLVSYAGASAGYEALAAGMPEPQDFPEAPLSQTSVVLDARGEAVAELPGAERREVVGSDEIDRDLKEAVVAVEDRRFYLHSGVDTQGVARAFVANARSGGVAQGGSTLTQQLMRHLYLPAGERMEVSLTRKWVEGALALAYEREHTKREVLTTYLNAVYFGAGAYGAEAASRTYFGKGADDLRVEEAALLAGIVQLPAYYDPFVNPGPAGERRDVVLGEMLEAGYLTQGEHDAAVRAPVALSPGGVVEAPEEIAHYVAAVRGELVAALGAEAVERGGLTVRTALDARAQGAARKAAEATLDPGGPGGDPAAAVAAVEPGTGRVRALMSHSGEDYAVAPFNLATQARRQPGSTFKPFVVAAALRQGIPLSARYDSRPLSLPGGYEVGNYKGIYRGPTSVEDGLVYSDNSVFTQLALQTGMHNVVDTAERLGIRAPMEPYPSTAIGGLAEGVSPVELAGAYATIAAGGTRAAPHLVLSVEQRGQDGEKRSVYEEPRPEPGQITEFEARETTRAMRSVVTKGGPRLSALDRVSGREIAGKTGTSELFRDAWFAGFPSDGGEENLATAVWVGYPEAEEPMTNVNGYREVDGSTVPLDLYARFVAGLR